MHTYVARIHEGLDKFIHKLNLICILCVPNFILLFMQLILYYMANTIIYTQATTTQKQLDPSRLRKALHLDLNSQKVLTATSHYDKKIVFTVLLLNSIF